MLWALPRPDPASSLWRLIASCLGIRSLWILGSDSPEDRANLLAPSGPMLAFADAATLRMLRRYSHDAELVVVLDGERFETVWGPRERSGSLASWEWRYLSPTRACYRESEWDPRGDGSVARTVRQALLLWRRSPVG
ncbi:MAG TPA: hypothetical protein VFB08_21560 [Burkholderiales bacterium]|nr:hypothetical protein [Burkholderiales bacterium]